MIQEFKLIRSLHIKFRNLVYQFSGTRAMLWQVATLEMLQYVLRTSARHLWSGPEPPYHQNCNLLVLQLHISQESPSRHCDAIPIQVTYQIRFRYTLGEASPQKPLSTSTTTISLISSQRPPISGRTQRQQPASYKNLPIGTAPEPLNCNEVFYYISMAGADILLYFLPFRF